MPFRFTVLSGLGLDRAHLMYEPAVRELGREKRLIWHSAVHKAVSEKLDAIMICGNLYDEKNFSYDSFTALKSGFLELHRAGVKVIYAHGKLDPSPVPRALDSPALSEFCQNTPQRLVLRFSAGAQGVTFFGSSYGYEGGGRFPQRAGVRPVIGVLPADTENEELFQEIERLRYSCFIIGGMRPAASAASNIVFASSPTGEFYGDPKSPIPTVTLYENGALSVAAEMPKCGGLRKIEVEGLESAASAGDLKGIISGRMDAFGCLAGDYILAALSGPSPLFGQITKDELKSVATDIGILTGCHVYIDKNELQPLINKEYA